jgi:hypothetical protein
MRAITGLTIAISAASSRRYVRLGPLLRRLGRQQLPRRLEGGPDPLGHG